MVNRDGKDNCAGYYEMNRSPADIDLPLELPDIYSALFGIALLGIPAQSVFRDVYCPSAILSRQDGSANHVQRLVMEHRVATPGDFESDKRGQV